MIKKSLGLCLTAFCIAFIVLTTFVSASKMKIEIPENFPAQGGVTFKVSLYDEQNNLIDSNIGIILEDAEKITRIEKTIPSNKPTEISLGESPMAGLWTITARYEDAEVKEFFTIEINEIAKFEIQGDKLVVKNMGNSKYIKTLQIVIGDTVGTKEVELEVGEETSLRLIAPDGTYNIKVTDGKTTITKNDVALTGNVIGILDEKLTTGGSPVTGGLKPEGETSDESFYSSIKNKKFVYIFLLVIIGSAILLAIERNYRKKM